MTSTKLTSRRLSSTPKRSRPVFAAVAHHRPDSFGSVVGTRISAEPQSGAPPSPSAPVFPPEGIWDGGQGNERQTDNARLNERPNAATGNESDADGRPSRVRLPGRWPLGLLGALGGLVLLVALSGQGHHATPHHGTAAVHHPEASGVGMPTTLPGNSPVKPLRIALVLGDGLPKAAQAREVRTLETWLSGHVNPATRLTVVDGRRNTSTAALPPARWSPHDRRRPLAGTLADAVRNRLKVGRGHRVLVTVDHVDPLPGQALARLQLILRRGAELPASVPLKLNRTIRRDVNPTETHALAATTARAVISISNMTGGEEE